MSKEKTNKTNEAENAGLNISVKSFLATILIIALLMVGTYALTFIIPGGSYTRILDVNGNSIIDVSGEFVNVEGGIPFWKWILSPFLVIGTDGGGLLIAIIAFLLVIGGVFTGLEESGMMKYMLDKIVNRFGKMKYRLLCMLTFFFMAMGALIGSFEECIPLVPVVVSLAVKLGWDSMTGLGMSLLAVGCGFASGVFNPFTVGVAQNLAGLTMFSGAGYRAVGFVLIYVLLIVFLLRHAKRIDAKHEGELQIDEFTANQKMDKSLVFFGSVVGAGILIVLSSAFITVLQDYTMIIIALMFLVAGVGSTLLAGVGGKKLASSFGKGVVNIFPAVLLILMASSIKYTLTEGKILDTILHEAVGMMENLPQWSIIIFIYLIVLVMNFFISSGSAKAFLLIPLIIPMAQIFGIEPQLCVMAFAFGDGFSNVFYPTNAALLIGLGLAKEGYGKLVKFSWKFQAINLLLTSILLLIGYYIGYN